MTAIKGNITPIGSSRYQLSDGSQAFVPPAPPAPEQVSTYTFGIGSADIYDIARFGFDCDVDFSSAIASNVASVTYKINGSTVTGSQTIQIGDTLRIEITRTNPAVASTLAITYTLSDNTEAASVPTYYYPTWTNLANVVVDTTPWTASKNALSVVDNGTGSFDKGANSVESFSGVWQLEIDRMMLGSVFGVSTTNNTATSLLRPRHAWYIQATNRIDIYESGSLKDALFTPSLVAANTCLRIVDTGSAIEYWYKLPGGSWTLRYTSLATYVANRVFYADIVHSADGAKTLPVRLTP